MGTASPRPAPQAVPSPMSSLIQVRGTLAGWQGVVGGGGGTQDTVTQIPTQAFWSAPSPSQLPSYPNLVLPPPFPSPWWLPALGVKGQERLGKIGQGRSSPSPSLTRRRCVLGVTRSYRVAREQGVKGL